MKNFVYVLYVELYGIWASENGACKIIGVYDNPFNALDKLEGLLREDLHNDLILDIENNVDDFVKQQKIKGFDKTIYVDIYDNIESYNKGYNNGCYVLRKKELNDDTDL